MMMGMGMPRKYNSIERMASLLQLSGLQVITGHVADHRLWPQSWRRMRQ
jgi:hypothetical protein